MDSIKVTRDIVIDYINTSDDCISNGFGRGDGVGYGFDDGEGFSGDDSGLGDGDGFGYGFGSSAGFASGDGDGGGFGYGDGFINSTGYEHGYCDIKVFNGCTIDYIDNMPTIIAQLHGNFAKGYIVNIDLTLIPCYIAKIGNSFAHGKTLKEAVVDATAKEMERLPIEKRIEKFREAFGPLDSEHTGKEFYDWHHILTGSCRMGRDEFCKSHNIGLTKMYSVKYFLDITEESYGGDIIKLIRKEYKNINE